jgi:hypothetical protein
MERPQNLGDILVEIKKLDGKPFIIKPRDLLYPVFKGFYHLEALLLSSYPDKRYMEIDIYLKQKFHNQRIVIMTLDINLASHHCNITTAYLPTIYVTKNSRLTNFKTFTIGINLNPRYPNFSSDLRKIRHLLNFVDISPVRKDEVWTVDSKIYYDLYN